MKKAFLTVTIITFISFIGFSLNIPKKLMGQYDAEVPSFEFEDKGRTVKASAYTISLILKEDFMWYKTGSLKFLGVYQDAVENGDLLDIDVEITNEVSITFDIALSVNKKTGSIAISGLTGVPTLTAQKREIVLKKKNRGFKRL